MERFRWDYRDCLLHDQRNKLRKKLNFVNNFAFFHFSSSAVNERKGSSFLKKTFRPGCQTCILRVEKIHFLYPKDSLRKIIILQKLLVLIILQHGAKRKECFQEGCQSCIRCVNKNSFKNFLFSSENFWKMFSGHSEKLRSICWNFFRGVFNAVSFASAELWWEKQVFEKIQKLLVYWAKKFRPFVGNFSAVIANLNYSWQEAPLELNCFFLETFQNLSRTLRKILSTIFLET